MTKHLQRTGSLLSVGARAGVKMSKVQTQGKERAEGCKEGHETQKQLSSLVWWGCHHGTSLSFFLQTPGCLGCSPLPPTQLFYLTLQPSHLGFQVGP